MITFRLIKFNYLVAGADDAKGLRSVAVVPFPSLDFASIAGFGAGLLKMAKYIKKY